MVAGKVKAAMGFHRSPATPKRSSPPRRSSPPAPAPSPAGRHGGSSSSSLAKSIGAYFPSPASRSAAGKKVQPRPPDVPELLRLVEELRERESRLRTELLEYKLVRETAAIVPFLEQQLAIRDGELDQAREAAAAMEAENLRLREELRSARDRAAADVFLLNSTEIGRRIRVDDAIAVAGGGDAEVERRRGPSFVTESDECSSSQVQFHAGAAEASAKSKLIGGGEGAFVAGARVHGGEGAVVAAARVRGGGASAARVPKPPPTPSSSSSCVSSSSSTSDTASGPPPPPPPPPPRRIAVASAAPAVADRLPPPPPPPPPPPLRISKSAVRRVPEVVEFYHSLMRRDFSRKDAGAGGSDAPPPSAAAARDMIGEIENRSSHLLAIKTEVETQGEFIRFLIKEVKSAAFTNVDDLVAFVKWLDDELSFLVDERAVLKHFEWPEQKADAMREAAFGYCDLRKMADEAAEFRDDPRQPFTSALKKMQALLDKVEHAVDSVSRAREGTIGRCRTFHIPWDWLLDSGALLNQIKMASVKLAVKYMKRVSSELENVAGGGVAEEEELMLRGVRFAFRVHQFARGFDVETMRAFQELKDKARCCRVQNQNNNKKQHPHHHGD